MILGQILAAWFYSHIFEYLVHRHILHSNKNFKRAFKHHFSQHHGTSRKNQMYDESYENLVSSKFEIIGLSFAALIHFPLVFFFPYAYATLLLAMITYYIVHRKAHTDVAWGKKYMPWHHDHHMGKNQHLNWGVRLPIIDHIAGTRVKSP
jgi:sterol desaturase/sphingolipid hydroxylase (fatty acid hydroxylase superfamily)